MSDTPSQQPTPAEETAARRKVVGGVLALLGGCLVIQFSFLYIASSDPSAVAEADYYAKAVRYEDVQRQRAKNEALGWQGQLSLGILEGGQRTLQLQLMDREGAPLTGCEHVLVNMFHKARAAKGFRGQLRTTATPGVYAVELPLRRHGIYEVRLEVQRGGETFTIRRDVSTPES